MAGTRPYRLRFVLAGLLSAGVAAGVRPVMADPAAADPAAADPAPTASLQQQESPTSPRRSPRVFHVPTAWLQPPGSVYATTGLNHRGGGFFALSGGLGRLAEVDVNVTDRFLECTADCSGEGRETSSAWVASALFKIGLKEDEWFAGQPALALGFRKSFYIDDSVATSGSKPALAELYGAASRRLGPVGLHLGAQLFDGRASGARLLDVDDPAGQLRPFAGIEWVPSIYPKTTVLLDLSWVPEFERQAVGYDLDLRWVGGWGIRYQALSWGSIELGVRHRQDEGLADSTVFVRVNATRQLVRLRRR